MCFYAGTQVRIEDRGQSVNQVRIEDFPTELQIPSATGATTLKHLHSLDPASQLMVSREEDMRLPPQ